MLFGAICLLEYILLIMAQIAWVSRWFIPKNIYCQNVFVPSLTEFITFQRLYNYVYMIQSMNGIVCWYNLLCFENNITKKSNLMTLDYSRIYYSRILLFVVGLLVYWKIEPNSRPSGNTWFTNWLQTGHVKVVKKKWHHRQQFLRFYYNK